MKMLNVVAVALSLLLCACGPEEVAIDAGSIQGCPWNLSFTSVFGWGTLQAGQTLTSTTGPGPAAGWTVDTCFTEALPPGVDYSCMSPAVGAIQMKVTNRTGAALFLGNRKHGASFRQVF